METKRAETTTAPALCTDKDSDFQLNTQTFSFNGKSNFTDKELHGFSVSEDFNLRGDVLGLLTSHGWKPTGETPFKLTLVNTNGETGTVYSDKSFQVDKDTADFKANCSYYPFHVFSLLECSGDYKEAEIRLKQLDFGKFENVRKSKIEKLIDNADVSYLTDKGEVDAAALIEYLSQNNIVRVSRAGNDSLNVYRIDAKVLREFNYKTDTLSFLADKVTGKNKTEIVNLIYKNRNAIIDIYKLMPGVQFDFQRDTLKEVYIPFSNAVLKVTAENMELVPFDSPQIKYFAECETQKHEFTIPDFQTRKVGNFEKFILYAVIGREATYNELTERERCDFQAFCSMIGYLISNYKNAAKTPAIILSDSGADDESRKGRRGKTILSNAISLFKKAAVRGGLEFDPTYRHNFATLTELDRLFILDDVPAGFNYNALYTQIAGNITSEKKGAHAVEIPFRDAPKFIITTNWAVRYDKTADSTNDRFKEFKFSYFWNVSNKPDAYFNELFFEDWQQEQWQMFFEFMALCAMEFLKSGLQEIQYNKDEDNFRAYFSNDVILQEMERLIPLMQLKIDTNGYFTSSEFLEAHADKFRFKPLFNHINLKGFINTYSAKFNKGIYQNNRRHWVIDSDFISDGLDFIN